MRHTHSKNQSHALKVAAKMPLLRHHVRDEPFDIMRSDVCGFAEIARRRRKRRALGKTNRAHRCLIPGFKLHSGNPKLFLPRLRQMGEDRSWGVALVPNTLHLAAPLLRGS